MKINKIILTMAIFVLLLPLAYADFCDLRGVLYYGDCNKEGDVKVLDEQDNEIAINLYSENSGCYNGVYKIVVSGGPSAGCILQENEIITFYLGGKLAGATKWSSTHLNREFELSAERVVYDVEAPDIIVTDEQGADVSTHGAGGGGGSGSGTRIFFATKQTDSGDVEIGKFDIPLDNEDSIEIQAPESGEVYLNVSGAQDTEILVPAMQEKGSVVVCIGSKSFFTCDKKLKLEKSV